MHNLPDFLNTVAANTSDCIAAPVTPYRELVKVWLLQMALALGWYRRTGRGSGLDVLRNDDFVALTGVGDGAKAKCRDADDDECSMDDIEDPDDESLSAPRRKPPMSDKARARRLKQAIDAARNHSLDPDLPLFRNVTMLGDLLGLTNVEKALVAYFVCLQAFNDFQGIVASQDSKLNRTGTIQLLASVLGYPAKDITEALGEDRTLAASRLLWLDWDHECLENKMNLISGLSAAMLAPHATPEALADRFLKRTGAPSLDCSAFPHLAQDLGTVTDFLAGARRDRTRGCNVLFHGPSGTGKTEAAKAIAKTLGMDLYEVGYDDNDGNPIKGVRRLAEFNLCQRLLSRQDNAVLLFDEIEDVFESWRLPSFLFGGGNDEGDGTGRGKAWINRTLEQNPTPAIWVTNDPGIDPAYLRRFSYSVRFPVPPQPVRLAIAQRYLSGLEPPAGWLERIAANEQTTPAQLESAAMVARLAAPAGNLARAREIALQTLDRSAALLDQKRKPPRVAVRTGYDLSYLNTDLDILRAVDRLKVRPYGTFCFYGPAGTGKTELARHFADQIGRPLLVRRASDLLNKYVGGSERNIAQMFAQAREQDAVLVLDEADSFLADRRGAHQSWEVTQVNELLTQMEAFEGLLVCTTNIMEALDQASLRRFAFKVKFDYLTADQRYRMFAAELERLGGNLAGAHDWEGPVRQLERVTPGDFAVAVRQAELWGEAPSAVQLYDQLRKECAAKGGPQSPIGFAG